MLKNSIYQKMIHLMLQSVPAALVAIDKDDRIVYFNFVRAEKNSQNKFIGRNFLSMVKKILGDDILKDVVDAYQTAKTGRKVVELFRLHYKKDAEMDFYYDAKFFSDNEEKLVICFIHNITDNVLLEKEFAEMIEEYENTTSQLQDSLAMLDIQLMEKSMDK